MAVNGDDDDNGRPTREINDENMENPFFLSTPIFFIKKHTHTRHTHATHTPTNNGCEIMGHRIRAGELAGRDDRDVNAEVDCAVDV